MSIGAVVVDVVCVEANAYGGVMIFLPIGVVADRRVGNEVTVVDVTAVPSVVPEARVITVAPNTFQFNSQVLFSLSVLGFAVSPSTTGKSVEYGFETITVATAVTAPYELDAVKV
jgi:hypothetical protein